MNAESEEEGFRLKKEIALVDVEIEELELRATFSKSRIKVHN